MSKKPELSSRKAAAKKITKSRTGGTAAKTAAVAPGAKRTAAKTAAAAPVDYDALVAKCRANLRAGRDVTAGLSAAQVEALMTRYSRFADRFDENGLLVGSEVVVHSLRPPRPFLHMMASNHFRLRKIWGSFWDGTGGGFCCLDSVLAGRMSSHLDTNYVPTSPEVQDVRRFWVHENGRAWPMFPIAGHEEGQYELYECRLGLDEFTLTARRNGIEARLVVHVPVDWPMEMWEVALTNLRPAPRKLSWFLNLRVNVDSYPFYYFCPRVVCEGVLEEGDPKPDGDPNRNTSRLGTPKSGLGTPSMVFLNHDQNNKHPRQAFLMSEPPFDGYDMMAEVFDGWSPRSPIPASVARGQCLNSLGLQPAAGLVAAAQFNADLPARGQADWRVIYGACSADAAERKRWLDHVRLDVLHSTDSRQQVAGAWDDKVRCSAIATPDRELNRYYNVWSKYQARNQARFCHALDKIGYRDIFQHLLGVADFEAPFVRSRVAEALQYQFPDGRAVRQYEIFPGGGHDLRMYQDSPIWIPDTVIKYVQETGDRDWLQQPVPYLDPQTLQPSKTDLGSIYDHAVRGVRSVTDSRGFHGLCRIGYGDWNDALSRIGGQKGVSVWLSCAGVYASRQMAALAAWMGRKEDAAAFTATADELTRLINEHAWDGQWYIYAINRDGEPIGSHANKEGRIHLNVNTWAIFSGVAAAGGREAQVWESIKLLATPVGHMLLDPPYSLASRESCGRIADMVPGQFENGSVYMHGESFYLYALIGAGRSDEWARELPRTLTSCLVPDITTGPPHQQSNYCAGPAHPAFGQNPFSNFTGSLAWYRRGIEAVAGVLADFEGLRIAPRPPSRWNEYRVTKSFRSCRVRAHLKRGPSFSVKLNGQDAPPLIPASMLRPGTVANVEVTYTCSTT